jgi:hypothetical protein
LGMGQQSTSGSHGCIWLLHSQLIHLVSPKMARLDTNYDSYHELHCQGLALGLCRDFYQRMASHFSDPRGGASSQLGHLSRSSLELFGGVSSSALAQVFPAWVESATLSDSLADSLVSYVWHQGLPNLQV